MDKVYGSAPWQTFWRIRSEYASPAFADKVAMGRAPVRGSALKKYQRGVSGPKGKSVVDLAEDKVRQYLMDVSTGLRDAREFLDPEGNGITIASVLRSWFLTQQLGLTEEQADALLHAEDPRSDGVILYEELLARLGPPKMDLSSMLRDRNKRGTTFLRASRSEAPVNDSVMRGSLEAMYKDTAEQLRQLAMLRGGRSAVSQY